MKAMNCPISFSIAAFTKLCVDKKEIPCFRGKNKYLISFFKEIKKEYPLEFESILFYNGHSEELDEEMFRLENSRLVYSWGVDCDPYEADAGMLILYSKYMPAEKQEIFDSIGKKMYERCGCDSNGSLGEHSKFSKEGLKKYVIGKI